MRALVKETGALAPALLLAWVPLVGDPLCVAAGWLRANPWLAAVFMAAGKFARYLAIDGDIRRPAVAGHDNAIGGPACNSIRSPRPGMTSRAEATLLRIGLASMRRVTAV